ncbi:MAG TPA: HAD-IA family hydrolase [Gemmatimonadaceae bacterium]|nr:HAD-IA family hydrolase [Gemmatimonadaceae bacterium]
MQRATPSASSIAVLFDLDGTLIDTVELIVSSARYAFSDRDGPRPTDAQWITGLGTPLITQFREWARDEEEVTRLVARYREFQMAHHDSLTREYAGVREALDALRARGYRTGIVTSKLNALARRGLTCVAIDDCFECIVGCDDTTRHKPDPEPVLHALDRLGIQPARAAFVGDSPFDIAAGNAAGVYSVGALWGPFTRSELEAAPGGVRAFAERPHDIPRIVANWVEALGTTATRAENGAERASGAEAQTQTF